MMLQNSGMRKRIMLPLPAELLAAVLLASLITLLAVGFQPNSFRDMMCRFASQPLLFVLNGLPVFLILLAFASLLGNVFWGGALTALLVGGTALANRLKIGLRYETVYPRDFLLLRETASAMGSYELSIPWKYVLLLTVTILVLILLGCLFQHRPSTGKCLPWLLRLSGVVAGVGVLVLLTLTVYASDNLYYGFDTSNLYNHITVANEYGFPYTFFHNFTAYSVDRPEGYDTDTAAGWDEAATASGAGKKVHVILVMNEAFSALTEWDAFTYSAGEDPMANFHRLQESPNAISGRIVVADIGGGTSNTEFDVLTGMQADALSPATSIAFGAVSRNLDSLFRIFGADGYATSFVHPSVGWFYNRENTYEKLGADTQIYAEDMANIQYKGTWPTDAYLAGFITDKFSTAAAAGVLEFSYITTFQNHMAYTADKYGADYVYPELSVNVPLSPEAETTLKVYIEGIRDADAMLGALTDYFSQSDEPVVLGFFGDHLPSLGSDQSVYSELGIDLSPSAGDAAAIYYPYATPYLLWTNDAGAEALDWENTAASLDLPENGYLSACYLGAVLLELTGRGSETPWVQFLNQLRRELPVAHSGTYMDMAGNVTSTLSDEKQAMLLQWRQWSYYKMKYKEIPE